MDYRRPVVFDIGTKETKLGFAGDHSPVSVFASLLGTRKSQVSSSDFKDHYVGEEAKSKRGVLTLKYPIERGIVTDWDAMEKLLKHCFKELREQPEETDVMFAEPALTPPRNREKLLQAMFETFAVPSLNVSSASVLSLYSSGRTTGVAVESGDGLTCTVPVLDGHALQYAVNKLDLAGQDVSQKLQELLSDKLSYITAEALVDMKEKSCEVLIDPSKQQSAEVVYELPDGQSVTIGEERFKSTEILFQPTLAQLDAPGLPEMVLSSILKTDVDIQRLLYKQIILSGGNTMLTGLPERLTTELRAQSPKDLYVLVPGGKRDFSTWIGGSIIASTSQFKCTQVLREEYEDSGPAIVHRKCF